MTNKRHDLLMQLINRKGVCGETVNEEKEELPPIPCQDCPVWSEMHTNISKKCRPDDVYKMAYAVYCELFGEIT